MKDGALKTVCLEDGNVRLSALNLGAITQGIWVAGGGAARSGPSIQGRDVPIVLGYQDPEAYCHDANYLGAIAGRIANRTANSSFLLDGQMFSLSANEAKTHLHGGLGGLSKRIWDMDLDTAGRRVELRYMSPDGEEGYPGTANLRVEIALSDSRVVYTMEASVDRPTPINLAQHNYYNLQGTGQIWNHRLQLSADRYTPVDADMIPTGAIESVDGTRLDYRTEAPLTDYDPQHVGTDINFVVNKAHNHPVATVRADNGLVLRMWSDQPALQFYTGTHLRAAADAHGKQSIAPFGGLCLEPQGFPNAMNEPSFPSIVATPEVPYRQVLTLEICQEAL
ncbi:MAG: aldose epimerase family protein [Pseudomonadota bacterium]